MKILLIVNYASNLFYIPFLYIIKFKKCYEAYKYLEKRDWYRAGSRSVDRSFFSRSISDPIKIAIWSDRPAISNKNRILDN